MDESVSKKLLVAQTYKQIKELYDATRALKIALKTEDDEQIKFVIATVRLAHEYLFNDAPKLAAKACLVPNCEHS